MTDESLLSSTLPSAAPETKRRKVRKGTQSCWECKRRKIKCTFAAPQDTACSLCRRRGITCVSQEFPQSSTEHVGDRLGRVEALVEQLVKNAGTGPFSSSTTNNPYPLLIPQRRDIGYESLKGTSDPPTLPSPLTVAAAALNTQLVDRNDEICRALLAVWPGERDLEVILSVPVDITNCLHGLINRSDLSTQKVPSPREILQLPVPGSHPVLVAQKLLILGSYLQAIPPCSIPNLGDLDVRYPDIMLRVVDAVHNLVNCNDDLVASIEGIECIAMESMYYNNAGNLRRSWITMRRAMLIAQIMGIHPGKTPSSLKTLECQTFTRPENIWFRLVQSDRYLSLMLGLPQGAPGDGFFATAAGLESCTPTERLQRIDCVVAGRIIQRNEADINDLAATQEIDRLLHKASMSMAPQWWLTPNLAPNGRDRTEVFHETIRLMDQFTHYHLVARLHLPYLLRSLAGGNYEYSKITAVNASREVLSRFVAFRSSNPIGSYCRGIDFLAFIASTTLCLAHIDGNHQGQAFAGDGDRGFFFNSLAHQRPTDRGMMERALASIEHMASSGPDIIASRIATIFRHLLLIEADVVDGSSYKTSSSANGDEGLECGGQLTDGGSVLNIHLPCFGTIKIERSGISRPTHSDEVPGVLEPLATSAHDGVSLSTSSLPGRQDEYTRQSLDTLDHPTIYSIGDQFEHMVWQSVPPTPQNSASAAEIQSNSSLRGDGAQITQPLFLGLEVDAGEWALQGVDTAFFDGLIQGSELDIAGISHQSP